MHKPVYTNDTSHEAEAVQLQCLRTLTPAERIRKACAMSHRNRMMAIEAIRRRHPSLSPRDVQLAFIDLAHGSALAADVRRWLEEQGA